MKNKKIWLGIAALALAVCLMGWLWMGNRETAVEGRKAVTVTVIHSDGREAQFHYGTSDSYLGQLLLSEELAEGDAGEFGLMIHTVDGETASWEENRSYWALYIGSEYATTGADSIPLTDGGEYTLVYTIG